MSITCMFACSSDLLRPRSKVAQLALLLMAGCPTPDAKPTQMVGAAKTREPVTTPVRGHAAQDAEAPPQATVPPNTCDAGADCTARGKEAFDLQRYLEAHQLFERACQLDDALGCKWLALDLKDANDPQIPADPARVAPTLEKACTLGELQACWMLGNGYLYGDRSGVVTPDPPRAVGFYQKGCDGGEAGSCASLANCYADGEGVGKDKALAKRYRKRAKELGYVGE